MVEVRRRVDQTKAKRQRRPDKRIRAGEAKVGDDECGAIGWGVVGGKEDTRAKAENGREDSDYLTRQRRVRASKQESSMHDLEPKETRVPAPKNSVRLRHRVSKTRTRGHKQSRVGKVGKGSTYSMLA